MTFFVANAAIAAFNLPIYRTQPDWSVSMSRDQLGAPRWHGADVENSFVAQDTLKIIRELQQPRWRWQQKPHKFAYLTMNNSIFARFARAFLIFWHFEDVLVLSTTWNELFSSCVSIWWPMLNFLFLCPEHWFQINSRKVTTNYSSIMTLNNWKMIPETRSYIFGSRSRFPHVPVSFSFLLSVMGKT